MRSLRIRFAVAAKIAFVNAGIKGATTASAIPVGGNELFKMEIFTYGVF